MERNDIVQTQEDLMEEVAQTIEIDKDNVFFESLIKYDTDKVTELWLNGKLDEELCDFQSNCITNIYGDDYYDDFDFNNFESLYCKF